MALYAMKELLEDAQKNGYGVGFFNALNVEMTRACIYAAQELRSPIILGTSEELAAVTPFEWIMPVLMEQARNASVPVAIHLDHTYSFSVLMQALRWGVGSVMYDGTREKRHEDNVKNSAEIVRVAHAMGVGVECELGSVSGLADASGQQDKMIYTEPGEAADFIDKTGADFLAVSIGTVHGVYKAAPRLDIPRLKEIRKAVNAPLVLHGGSGLSDDDFRSTIAGGICKINVYTDVVLAGQRAHALHAGDSYAEQLKASVETMKEAVKEKLLVFGSANRA